MALKKQTDTIADFDLDKFNSRLNTRLLELQEVETNVIENVTYGITQHITFEEDKPVYKPYYTTQIYYTTDIAEEV